MLMDLIESGKFDAFLDPEQAEQSTISAPGYLSKSARAVCTARGPIM